MPRERTLQGKYSNTLSTGLCVASMSKPSQPLSLSVLVASALTYILISSYMSHPLQPICSVDACSEGTRTLKGMETQ